MMEDTFPAKRRRKSSFFRKSLGANSEFGSRITGISEFGGRTTGISEIGTTALNFTEYTSSSCGSEETTNSFFELLKAEKKQRQEYYKKVKTQYQLLKTEDLSAAVNLGQGGQCLTESDLKFINAAPDYNAIFAKYENLKETMLIESRTHAQLEQAMANSVEVFENKVLSRTKSIVKKLAEETMTLSDVLDPDITTDDSGFVMESFLSSADSDLDRRSNYSSSTFTSSE